MSWNQQTRTVGFSHWTHPACKSRSVKKATTSRRSTQSLLNWAKTKYFGYLINLRLVFFLNFTNFPVGLDSWKVRLNFRKSGKNGILKFYEIFMFCSLWGEKIILVKYRKLEATSLLCFAFASHKCTFARLKSVWNRHCGLWLWGKRKMFSRHPFFNRPQTSCEGYVFTGVCLSTGGGVSAPEGFAWVGVSAWWGVSVPGGVSAPGGVYCRAECLLCTEAAPPPRERQLLLRTVRILLECILVSWKFPVVLTRQFL